MLESQKKLDNQVNEIENIESSDEKLLSIIDELKLKISAKIKSNVIYPPNIDNKISAIFEVKVSITGDVLEVALKEPSGNAYFDNAIEVQYMFHPLYQLLIIMKCIRDIFKNLIYILALRNNSMFSIKKFSFQLFLFFYYNLQTTLKQNN